MYDAAAKAVAAQNFAKAITDLDAWKQKVPASDYADERSVLLIQSYGGAKQFDKVLAEAEPMLAKDLDKAFPDPKGGPGQVLAVLLTSAVAIQNIPQPTPQQLATAEKAAHMLQSYNRKPEGLDDAAVEHRQGAIAERRQGGAPLYSGGAGQQRSGEERLRHRAERLQQGAERLSGQRVHRVPARPGVSLHGEGDARRRWKSISPRRFTNSSARW